MNCNCAKFFFFSVPAKVIKVSEHMEVVEGRDVVLVCIVEGYPNPRVVWRSQDTSVVQNDTRNTNLTLRNVLRHSNGAYQCEATNKLSNGSDSKTVKLDVLCEYFSFSFFFSFFF